MRDLGQPNAAAIRSNVPQLGHRLASLESGWATPVYSVRREPTVCHGARRPPDDDLMLGRLDASRCPTLNLESGLEKRSPKCPWLLLLPGRDRRTGPDAWDARWETACSAAAARSRRVPPGRHRRIVRPMTRRSKGWTLIALGVVALLPFASRVAGEVFNGRSIGIAPIDIIGAVLLLVGLKLRADVAEAVPPPPPRPDVRPSDRSER
jgi:hypothetical protein